MTVKSHNTQIRRSRSCGLRPLKRHVFQASDTRTVPATCDTVCALRYSQERRENLGCSSAPNLTHTFTLPIVLAKHLIIHAESIVGYQSGLPLRASCLSTDNKKAHKNIKAWEGQSVTHRSVSATIPRAST